MPFVSVLLPVHNGAPFVYEAVESMLKQDFDDYEVVVVDDGSSDDTLNILDKFTSDKLKVIEKENSGLVDSLNLGLLRTDAKYIARMDADDISFAHRIRTQTDFMEFSQLSASSCGSILIDEAGRVTSQYIPADVKDCNEWWLPAAEPYLPHPFLMFDLEVVQRIGGYRHVLYAEDADLYWRLQDIGPIVNMQDFLGKYRVHSSSVSGASAKNSRIQSVFSQAAAISAQRRAKGDRDIEFNIPLSLAKSKADTLESVCSLFKSQLSEVEWYHLCAAAGLKLLEFADWRPFDHHICEIIFLLE